MQKKLLLTLLLVSTAVSAASAKTRLEVIADAKAHENITSWTSSTNTHVFASDMVYRTLYSTGVAQSSLNWPYVYGGRESSETTASRINSGTCPGGPPKDGSPNTKAVYDWWADDQANRAHPAQYLAGIDCNGFVMRMLGVTSAEMLANTNAVGFKNYSVAIEEANLKLGDLLITDGHIKMVTVLSPFTVTEAVGGDKGRVITREAVVAGYLPYSPFPIFTELTPSSGTIVSEARPEIKAKILTGTPINIGNVVVKVDGNTVLPSLTSGTKYAYVSYAPTEDLTDGNHKFYIWAKNDLGLEDEIEQNFIVDNKRPYVESVSIYNDEPNDYYPSSGTLLYDRKWKASNDILISTGPDVDLPLATGAYHAVITFSEFMEDGSLDIGALGETLEISSVDSTTTYKTIATAGFTVGQGVYSADKLQTLTINATDYAGNMLLAVGPERTQIDPATELTRNSSGDMQGVGGVDTMHALRIEAAAPEIGWANKLQVLVSTCPGVCGTQEAPLEFNYSTLKFRYKDIGSGFSYSEIRAESGKLMWGFSYPELMYYYDTLIMLPDGKYRQTVIDNAGRERVMWFRVDTVSPRVEISSVSVSRGFGTFAVSGSVRDSLSGLKSLALKNNLLVSSVPVSLTEGTTEQVEFNFSNVDASVDAYYELNAEDKAGNLSQPLMQFNVSDGIMADSIWTVGHHVTKVYATGSPCSIKLEGIPNSYDVPLRYDYTTTTRTVTLDVDAGTTPVVVAILDDYLPGKLHMSVLPEEAPTCTAWIEGSSMHAYQPIPAVTENNDSILYSSITFSLGLLDVTLDGYSVTSSNPEFVLKSAASPELPDFYVAYPFTSQPAWSVRYSGISYAAMTLYAYGLPPGLSAADRKKIRMLEYSDGGGATDITVSVDTNVVTGRTTSNSVFVVAAPVEVFDKTGPITTFISSETYVSGELVYVSSAAGISLYSTDTSSFTMALAGVASTYYLVDVSSTPECLATTYDPYAASGTCANPVYAGPFTVAEGLHSLYYNAVDNIGNYGVGGSSVVYSDGTAPWTELMLNSGVLSPDATVYAGISDVITMVSSDTISNGVASGLATSYFLIDVSPSACSTQGGGGLSGIGSCENPYYGGPLSLPAGEHVIYYLAADNVGNRESLKSVNFVVAGSSQATFGIAPSSGPIGVSFVIGGSGFGSYSEDYSGVLLGDVTAQISSWSDSSIAAQLPGTLAAGEHAVSVLYGTTTLAEIGTFTVTTPSIYSIDPATGAIGMPFTLTGESFGTYADSHTWVVAGGTTAVITYWSDSLITAEFPASLAVGTHGVQVLRMYDDTLAESATVYAYIEEPVISTMTPTAGSAGSEFLIEGTGFGDYVSSYTRVMAGGLECELTMWVSTAIAGVIPSELEIGTYTVVAVRGEAVSNGIEYTVSGYRAQSARSYSMASLEFKLGQVYVYPDPAKGGKVPKFHIEVGLADAVRIRIYNVAGEQVHSRTLSGNPQAVGSVYAYEYPWEGRIASGVYYYTMEAERAGKKLKVKGKFAVVR